MDQLGKRFPAQYAGLELLAGKVVVYRKASGGFDQALQDLHLPAELVVRDAPYSAAELQTLVERISGDSAYWRGIGLPINSFGARHDGTAVEVGTAHPEAVRRQVVQRYGAAPPVVVIESALMLAPMPHG